MDQVTTLLTKLSDVLPEAWLLAVGGGIIGAIFGASAQQSRFCLRAATVEFSRGHIGKRTAVWLLVFSSAIALTEVFVAMGALETSEARLLASPQSLSGAAIGGLLFGSGMVLARGCASRLLVLSATGNLRALLSGLVFVVVAQASMDGALAPLRRILAGQLIVPAPGGNDLISLLGIGPTLAFASAQFAVLAAIVFAIWRGVSVRVLAAAVAAGVTVPLAWLFTYLMSTIAFDPVQIESITFTGPSADTLMLFLIPVENAVEFDTGLVPGVFAGAFLAAAATGELRLEGFEGAMSMSRYLAGGAMMGFGGMLAGGCAVGAGVSGASVFALTAWVTLAAMWLSAGLTDWLVDRPATSAAKHPLKVT